MLGDKDAVANLAVRDLAVARKFYEGTLGLRQVDGMGDELVTYRTGHTAINVYVSREAGTNKATAVTWSLGSEIESTMKALAAKGVAFEHYDMPGMRREGDLHIEGDMKVAWFKDPDGNILNLINQ